MTATNGTTIAPDRPGSRLGAPLPATRRSFLAMMAVLFGPSASAQHDAAGRAKSAFPDDETRDQVALAEGGDGSWPIGRSSPY